MKYLLPLGLLTFSADAVRLSPASNLKPQQPVGVTTLADVVEKHHTMEDYQLLQRVIEQDENSEKAEFNLA